jgi:hypothetical protein
MVWRRRCGRRSGYVNESLAHQGKTKQLLAEQCPGADDGSELNSHQSAFSVFYTGPSQNHSAYTHPVNASEDAVPLLTFLLERKLALVLDARDEDLVLCVDVEVGDIAVYEPKSLFGLLLLPLGGVPCCGTRQYIHPSSITAVELGDISTHRVSRGL